MQTTKQDISEYVELLEQAVLSDEALERIEVSRKEMYHYLFTKSLEPDTMVPIRFREQSIEAVLNKWYSYDVLQPIMDDPFVSDVHVIGTTTLVKRNGVRFESTESCFGSTEAFREFIDRKLEYTPYTFSESDPITDGILSDGYRLNIIGGPSTRYTVQDDRGRIVTEPRTIASIRKPIHPFTLDELVQLNVFTPELREWFRLMMLCGDSYIIAGGVGSTKTTLMNALTGDIPDGLLNIIVEELPEMAPFAKWCIRLTNRNENAERRGQIDMSRNIINTLRMDNDNLFIGEVRDPQLAYLFLRVALLVKVQTATTFHVHVDHKKAVEAVLMRFLLEATDGAGAHASYANTASLMADRVRHIIVMSNPRYGIRVAQVGEILEFDMQERAILWQPVYDYDFRSKEAFFHGVTEDMRERAEIADLSVNMKRNEQPIRKFYIA